MKQVHSQRAELAAALSGSMAMQRWEKLIRKTVSAAMQKLRGPEGIYWRLTSVIVRRRAPRAASDTGSERCSDDEGRDPHLNSARKDTASMAGGESGGGRGRDGGGVDGLAEHKKGAKRSRARRASPTHEAIGPGYAGGRASSGILDNAKKGDTNDGAGVCEGSNGERLCSPPGGGGGDVTFEPATRGGSRHLEEEVAGLSMKMTTMLGEMHSLRSVGSWSTIYPRGVC